MNSELKHLRKRFVSDMNLPIQVIQSPYFEERLELLENEFESKTKYDNLLKIIDEKFQGNINKFLEHYSETRNLIITSLTHNDAWFNFIRSAIGDVSFEQNEIIGERNLYTQEQDGCLFISFDMRKANYQALKYVSPELVLNTDTYEDLIGKFTDLDYIKESKYTRQVIFGQMNPKRTMKVEKKITTSFAHALINGEYGDLIDMSKFNVFSVNSDEVIFKFNGAIQELDSLPNLNDFVYEGVTFRFNKFQLRHRQFKLATSDSKLNIFEKVDFIDGHRTHLHCVPATYYPQVYKLLGGMEIKPSDLVFYYEHELCQFMNPIELVK